jgi:hypothetical protein
MTGPDRWRMTQACRDAYHRACARTDGACTCMCHANRPSGMRTA